MIKEKEIEIEIVKTTGIKKEKETGRGIEKDRESVNIVKEKMVQIKKMMVQIKTDAKIYQT